MRKITKYSVKFYFRKVKFIYTINLELFYLIKINVTPYQSIIAY